MGGEFQRFTLLAGNAVVRTARPPDIEGNWFVAASDKQTGEELWKAPLPSEPRFGGLAIDQTGRVYVVLREGAIVCYGPA